MHQPAQLESTLNRVDFAGLALTKTANGYECSVYYDNGVWSDPIEKPTAAEALLETLLAELVVKPLFDKVVAPMLAPLPPPY